MKTKVVLASCILLFVFHNIAVSGEPLRRKLGQLFIVGFLGPTVTDTLLSDLSTRNIGGVILSYVNGNLVSPTQIQQLIAQLQSDAQTPLFICADQEGGKVARLDSRDGFLPTYSAYKLGMVFKSVDSTRAEAQLMASWMKGGGFNLNLAPVVDIAANPYDSTMYSARRYSTDPDTVTAHAQTFIDQFHLANVMTTIKHFPGGFGGTPSDLRPYRLLMDSNRVDMIMVTHELVPQIDPIYYTSLSPAAVQGLLRDSMGYQGVVITDDLYQMATAFSYGYGKAAELAINAGDDILLYVGNTVNNASLVRQIIDTLEADVQEGKIAMARVDQAYDRIMQLKNRYRVTSAPIEFGSNETKPKVFELLQNYPNPFNPSTTIRFDLPQRSRVRLAVYNILGQEVAKLANGEMNAGNFERVWNAKVASGVYFYRIEAVSITEGKRFVDVKKMILLK